MPGPSSQAGSPLNDPRATATPAVLRPMQLGLTPETSKGKLGIQGGADNLPATKVAATISPMANLIAGLGGLFANDVLLLPTTAQQDRL